MKKLLILVAMLALVPAAASATPLMSASYTATEYSADSGLSLYARDVTTEPFTFELSTRGAAAGWNAPVSYAFGTTGRLGIGLSSETELAGTAVGKGRFFLGGVDAAPVPEPASILLFGSGLVGLASLARRLTRK